MYDFVIKNLDDKIVIFDEDGMFELANYFDNNGIRSITINEDNCLKLNDDVIFQLVKKIYYESARDGINPMCKSNLIKKYINTTSSLLVTDIEPINFDGEIDINDSNTSGICIELPVRNACEKLNSMGIVTLMSSANKKDVLTRDEKIKMLSNFGHNEHFNIGNGYAWIMIDWESLSQENKQRLILLNNGTTGIELSDKEKNNLIHNCSINKIEVSQKELIKFLEVFDYRIFTQDKSKLFHLSIESEEDAYFQANRQGYACINSLCNHGINYRTVVLRYPLDNETTVTDVDRYFLSIICNLLQQEQKNNYKLKSKELI